jgi:hypothetical protein
MPTINKITTTTVTTTEITLDYGDEYEDVVVPITPADWIDPWVNEEGTRLIYAAHDDCPMDYEFPEGVEFIQSNSRNMNYESDVEGWLERVNNDPGLVVFPVGVYEHGLVQYSLAGESMHSGDQWDYVVGACIAIPTDYTDPESAARNILAEYTAYCNGDAYVIVSMERENADAEWSDDYEVIGGYFGSDSTQELINTGYDY